MENNPLRQYFRRPVMYFKLPSDGKYYAPGVVNFPPNRELPVYAMTAIDEMTIRTPDALFNGTAVTELMKSCVPNILDPWSINSIDLDAILVAIRAASNDGKLELDTKCPACEQTASWDIDLMNLLSSIPDVDYDSPLLMNELKIKFRPLTQTEINKNELNQFEVQRILAQLESYEDSDEKQKHMADAVKKLNDLVMNIVASTIEWIETPETQVTNQEFIHDFLVNTDKRTNDAIKDHSLELKNKSQLKPLEIKCIHCQHEYKQRFILNVSDFFG